jgi:L-alanine-DL-glutamate epimerase-like enolase superfamily enzyme
LKKQVLPIFFFEDPIEPENMDAWGYVAAHLPMPVAMGERLYTIYQTARSKISALPPAPRGRQPLSPPSFS